MKPFVAGVVAVLSIGSVLFVSLETWGRFVSRYIIVFLSHLSSSLFFQEMCVSLTLQYNSNVSTIASLQQKRNTNLAQ